jgi:hypothetical protein
VRNKKGGVVIDMVALVLLLCVWVGLVSFAVYTHTQVKSGIEDILEGKTK